MKLSVSKCGSFAVVVASLGLFGCIGADTVEDEGELVAEAELALRDTCGGLRGAACDEGEICVDDPSDGCDPAQGAMDCGGVCVKDKAKKDKKDKDACDEPDPSLQYVSQDPEQCALIHFQCEVGFVPFFDECGCGCEPRVLEQPAL